MDLCIGILVYEIDPSSLVNQLIQQLNSLDCQGYILIHDDGSSKQWQDSLQQLKSKYPKLELSLNSNNEGRSKARNKILSLAKADYLLMIDGDALVDSSSFLSNYWQKRSKKGIVVGSKKLKDTRPIPGSELRWEYAKAREIRSLSSRKLKPQLSFQTNCFLIDIKEIKGIRFDHNLKGYGHEDSLFGLAAAGAGFHFSHIDNPALYTAEEKNLKFLEKTDQALRNLLYIEQAYPHFRDAFPLLRLKRTMNKWKLEALFYLLLKSGRKVISKNLVSAKPSMRLFDLYRMLRLLDFERLNKTK